MGSRVAEKKNMIQEIAADDESINLAGDKEALISALEKVIKASSQGKSDSDLVRLDRLRGR